MNTKAWWVTYPLSCSSPHLVLQGIPIVYYGTEQGYCCSNDPNNRVTVATLWQHLEAVEVFFRFFSADFNCHYKKQRPGLLFETIWYMYMFFDSSFSSSMCSLPDQLFLHFPLSVSELFQSYSSFSILAASELSPSLLCNIQLLSSCCLWQCWATF